MHRYAIEIKEEELELITLLNQGVTPKIEKDRTWFVFDATWNTKVQNEIWTDDEVHTQLASTANRPLIYRLK